NFVVEACLGWGPIVGTLAILALVVALARRARPAASRSARLGLFLACSGWWCQNLLDLGTEIFGVGLFGVSLLAVVLEGRAQASVPVAPSTARGGRWVGAVLVSGLLVAPVFLPRQTLRDLRAEPAVKSTGEAWPIAI